MAEIEVSCMKSGSDVMPYLPVATSARNIQEKNDARNNLKQTQALKDATSKPLWSKTLTGPVVTAYAEGILQLQYSLAKKSWLNCVQTEPNTWLGKGGILKAPWGTPVPKFVRTRTVSRVGTYLICSCGFFERFGLPCRHLFAVIQRGPRPSDCATRWRRDYLAYGLTGKAELDRLFKEAKMQEPIGPFYCDEEGKATTIYPYFICGDVRYMKFFTAPIEHTLYYVQGCNEIRQSTAIGKIVPEEELPSELHMSQLGKGFLEEGPTSEQGFLESSHAYTLLYPTFKRITSIASADRGLLSLCYVELKGVHKTLLTKLALISERRNKENTPPNAFRLSNLELNGGAQSNKQIQPRGEACQTGKRYKR